MHKEREPLPNPQVADINFHLPDGLVCHWNFYTSSTSTSVLLENARELAQETQSLGQESRLSGHKDSIQQVSETIQSEFPDLSINSGKTRFFEQSLSDTTNLLIPNWDDISHTYSVNQLMKPTQGQRDIVASFMKDSFHNTSDQQIEVSLRNSQNKVFLVTTANLYVGMFVLIEVPRLAEIQLHSVAGRGSTPEISQEKGKLPILLSAMVQAINQDSNYVDRSTSSFAPPYQKLTFSSSGAALLYEDLGFVESDRGGISIKTKTR